MIVSLVAPRRTLIRDWRFGALQRLLHAGILAYVVIYEVLLQASHMDVDYLAAQSPAVALSLEIPPVTEAAAESAASNASSSSSRAYCSGQEVGRCAAEYPWTASGWGAKGGGHDGHHSLVPTSW